MSTGIACDRINKVAKPQLLGTGFCYGCCKNGVLVATVGGIRGDQHSCSIRICDDCLKEALAVFGIRNAEGQLLPSERLCARCSTLLMINQHPPLCAECISTANREAADGATFTQIHGGMKEAIMHLDGSDLGYGKLERLSDESLFDKQLFDSAPRRTQHGLFAYDFPRDPEMERHLL